MEIKFLTKEIKRSNIIKIPYQEVKTELLVELHKSGWIFVAIEMGKAIFKKE